MATQILLDSAPKETPMNGSCSFTDGQCTKLISSRTLVESASPLLGCPLPNNPPFEVIRGVLHQGHNTLFPRQNGVRVLP